MMIPTALRALLFGGSLAAAAAVGTLRSAPPPVEGPEVAPTFYARLGAPIPQADGAARAQFERGRQVAMRKLTPGAGLGPAFNGVACASCHEKPVVGGGASRYRTVHLEAGKKESFVVPVKRMFAADPARQRPIAGKTAQRVPPPFFGVGLLSEIAPEEIIKRADPTDRDRDGISGRVNFERGFIGRFGRKAQMASLQGFVRLALLDHMGITTDPVKPAHMVEREAPVELPTRDDDGARDPELAPGDLVDLLAFVALLAPPAPDRPTETTRAGEKIFSTVGCAACHTPALAGPRGPVPAFTDLLLHDLGPALDDDVAIGEAGASEFRTQPLWGIAAAGPYLHDGRADTIDEAIRAHGGEAAPSSARYAALPSRDRDALVAFLRSLGGGDQRSDGLLPRDAPIPAAGELGGPIDELDGAARARFARGRELFDHDFARREGLGGAFNGDACRSCHFDPVIGGAGPSDVDVLRHGVFALGASIAPPSGDTMAHRFVLGSGPPTLDRAANIFERRQTPTLFGLGLVDAIDDDAIRAAADPDDRDRDGVRGRVSDLDDGRVGRFGWKAQLATLSDFVADAFANELGVRSTGPKPEIAKDDFDDVVYFLAKLAPPKPRGGDDTAMGRAAFGELGCATCHRADLVTRDGAPVPLYSDLLLHDVEPRDTSPVAQTRAGRAFRTAPLWGISSTAPYWHDGSAETLDDAVRRHAGEASMSRARYAQAHAAVRAALVSFLRSL